MPLCTAEQVDVLLPPSSLAGHAAEDEITEIAHTRVRYGFGRTFVLLRREGFADNHKRLYRIYMACGLNLRTKRPKRNRMAVHRLERPQTPAINQTWSMDFVQDALFNGERFRILAELGKACLIDGCFP